MEQQKEQMKIQKEQMEQQKEQMEQQNEQQKEQMKEQMRIQAKQHQEELAVQREQMELWPDYWSRFCTFLVANAVPDDRKAQVFLTNQTPAVYKQLANLAAQQNPRMNINDLTMDQIVEFMKEQFDPKLFIVRERFKFWSNMERKPGETLQELAARIRQDAATCDFPSIQDPQDEALRQRFICSVNNEAVLKALFKVKDTELDFAKAVKIAIETEDAAKVAKETVYGSKPRPVNKVKANNKGGRPKNHQQSNSTTSDSAKCYRLDVPVTIQDQQFTMELDTATTGNFVSVPVWKQLGKPKLDDVTHRYESASKHDLPVLGTFMGQTKDPVTGKQSSIPYIVTKIPDLNLLGRNAIQALGISVDNALGLKSIESQVKSEGAKESHPKTSSTTYASLQKDCHTLCDKFPDLFKEELGCLKDFELEVKFKSDAKPVFHKARPVPFALRDDLTKGYEEGIAKGVWKPVQFNDYGTPVVPIQELMQKLGGGFGYTKIDLADAYNQIKLAPESQRRLALSTHRGFILVTDHKPLTALFGPKKGTPLLAANRLARWALWLNQFDYTIEYRKTADHGNADALSRLPSGDDIDFDREESGEDTDMVCAIRVLSLQVKPFDSNILRQESGKDPVIATVMRYVREGWPLKHAEINEEVRKFQKLSDSLSICHGCLIYGTRVVIPQSLQPKILDLLHIGHFGMERMKQLARTAVYWPGIDAAIEMTSRRYDSCGEHQNKPSKPPAHPWMLPEKPWSRVHLDHAINFMGTNWLVITDAYSKYPCIHPTSSTSTRATLDLLEEDFAHFGYPHTLVSDNATAFVSEEFQSWRKERGITHLTGAPYHPATNGAAERLVQTFKQALRKSSLPPKRALQEFLMQYRRMPTSCGFSPSELLMSRQIRTRIDTLLPSPAHIAQGKQSKEASKTQVTPDPGGVAKVTRQYKAGDPVYALYYGPHHAKQPRWVPAVVKKSTGTRCFNVKVVPRGPVWRRHWEQLRPRYASEEDNEPGDSADAFELPIDHPMEILENVPPTQNQSRPRLPRTKPPVPDARVPFLRWI
nr:hypothetical protein BaRGS_004461 [Batillaria attramentaria]